MGIRIGTAKLLQRLSGLIDPASIPTLPLAPVQPVPRVVHRTAQDPAYVAAGAANEAEAKRRYAKTKERDPFPDVPPALLNSAHIEDYILETAMVFPYEPKRRKSASYALRVGKRLAFYDAGNPKQTPFYTLDDFKSFELPPNSLVYVQTKELFQLPNYMAVRFNLHIELVHKGLLLGTGPLVDPGFSGRLLIPLHNMTANTYVLAENDELIWVEFTKTSPNPEWLPPLRRPRMKGAPRAAFAPFPGDKTDMRVEDYFSRARAPHESRPDSAEYPFPANAIPGGVEEARVMANRAREQSEQAGTEAERAAGAVRQLRNLSFIGGIIAAAAVIWPIVELIGSTQAMVQTTTSMADGSNGQIRALEARLAAVRREFAAHALIQARLLRAEYCDAVVDPTTRFTTRSYILRRLRVAQAAANDAAKQAGNQSPFVRLTAADDRCGP